MRKILGLILGMVLLCNIVFGLKITEVMYAPNQTESNTDGEWIELYNDGAEAIGLGNWTIDGYSFDDIVISPGQYVVVARELIDGSDSDTESFETAWGNGDGVWNETDGPYEAVDGYFQLGEIDTINLSDGLETITASYNSSLGANGNGMTLELDSDGIFQEGLVSGGTPGMENSVVGGQIQNNSDGIGIEVTINNKVPGIKAVVITPDDSTGAGIQVMPNVNANKTVTVNVNVEDLNGFTDLTSVTANVKGIAFQLGLLENTSGTEAAYAGSFEMGPSDGAGFYGVNVTVADSYSTANLAAQFEYLGIISTELSSYSVSFGSVDPGSVSGVKNVTVSNTGNVALDVSLIAELEPGSGTLGTGSIEGLFGANWLGLDLQRAISDLMPSDEQLMSFRIKAPSTVNAKKYRGTIVVTAVAR